MDVGDKVCFADYRHDRLVDVVVIELGEDEILIETDDPRLEPRQWFTSTEFLSPRDPEAPRRGLQRRNENGQPVCRRCGQPDDGIRAHGPDLCRWDH